MHLLYTIAGAAAYLSVAAFAGHFDEARDMTRVTISAVKHDSKTGAEGGCGTDGCRPELLYDGDLDPESRWSCQQPYDPDSYDECAVFFSFHEPQHMAGIQIAFLNGDTRQRTVHIQYELADDYGGDGGVVNVGEFTSSGTTNEFEEITFASHPLVSTRAVTSVTISAPTSTPVNQWLSITEVELGVYGVICAESNPNQACADDVADRKWADFYLGKTDDELWELLVNGKGVGLCNIRVAGEGEDTDLYAYTGFLTYEGNHGYPDGKNAGYVSTPDWPSGSPDSAAVCADYDGLFGEPMFCSGNGRTNAVAQIRRAISNAYCCLSY